jgi:hypothetical protein
VDARYVGLHRRRSPGDMAPGTATFLAKPFTPEQLQATVRELF